MILALSIALYASLARLPQKLKRFIRVSPVLSFIVLDVVSDPCMPFHAFIEASVSSELFRGFYHAFYDGVPILNELL